MEKNTDIKKRREFNRSYKHHTLYFSFPSRHFKDYLNLSDGIVEKCETDFYHERVDLSNSLYEAYASHIKKGVDLQEINKRAEAAKEMISLMAEEHEAWGNKIAAGYERKATIFSILTGFAGLFAGDGFFTNNMIPRVNIFFIFCPFLFLLVLFFYNFQKVQCFDRVSTMWRETSTKATASFMILNEAVTVKMLHQPKDARLSSGDSVPEIAQPNPPKVLGNTISHKQLAKLPRKKK